MAFTYTAADRASVILTALTAIDPLSLPNDRDRAALTYLKSVLQTLPATYGVIVTAYNDDVQHINVQVQHQAFGSYAS